MGDYMLAKGLLLSLDNDEFQFLKVISDSVRRMSEAEILQIAKSKALDIDEETYLRIISDKTASLLSTCCQIGAISVIKSPEIAACMREYGENLGMVFQIRDDVLDYIGRRSITGKPTGIDLKEKKLTLPLIYSLANAPKKESKQVLRIIRGGTKKQDVQTVVDFAVGYGGINYTVKKAGEYSKRALDALSVLPASAAKESLQQFVTYVLERSK